MPSESRVLLTGATGFIGSALSSALAARGHEVRPLAVDLTQGSDLAPSVAGQQIVIHCAARAHVTREREADPLAAYRALNRDATIRLAEAAEKAGVRRFIFLSSIGVLGERTLGTPFGPDSAPAPIADYAISKWEAEQGLRAIAERGRMEVVVIRPTLVHGPGAPGNFRRLLRLVASGVPLPLAAVDGRRTFVSRANLSSLILASMTHPDAPRAPLLAGDQETLTLPALLRVLADGMRKPLRLFPLPGLSSLRGLPGVGGPLRKLTDSLVVDTRETSSRLGWAPVESAETGLRAMAAAWNNSP